MIERPSFARLVDQASPSLTFILGFRFLGEDLVASELTLVRSISSSLTSGAEKTLSLEPLVLRDSQDPKHSLLCTESSPSPGTWGQSQFNGNESMASTETFVDSSSEKHSGLS